MSDFFAEPFGPELTKSVVAAASDDFASWADEDVTRSVILPFPEVRLSEPGSNVLLSAPKKAASAPAAPAPSLPPSPYFLEKTSVRSRAVPVALLASVHRRLSAHPTARVAVNAAKYKISCSLVRDYIGLEMTVRVWSDAATKESVVECQCLTSRGKTVFLTIFNEIAATLVAEGLADEQGVPKFGRPCSPAPLSLPDDLRCSPDLSSESLSPIFAMVRCPCSDVRREGLSVLAHVVGSASPKSASRLLSAGVMDVLREVEPMVEAEFEARANCAAAIATLLRC